MSVFIIIASVIAVAALAIIGVASKLIQICSPNEVLIFSGTRRRVAGKMVGYRYKKGGTGGLVKCFVERIVEDLTAGDLRCHECGSVFARAVEIGGKPAHKIVSGKVFTRGMRRR